MDEEGQSTAPRLFVSYSWSNPDHEDWVLQLSTELCGAGVDVVLDKWDLREGHDAHAFMEQMVTDPTVDKVLLVCDRMYAEKADQRSGGVGTEAQIISGEIYEKRDQEKYVALVVERDSDGRACLPAYYRSRIYIDFSEPSKRALQFEQLVRWIFDRPLHLKPEIGEPPQFLSAANAVMDLGAAAHHSTTLDLIRNGSAGADGAISEYLSSISHNLEKLRIADEDDGEFDEHVITSIEAFMPTRNGMIDLFRAIADYRETPETRRVVQRFFESLLPYLDSRPSERSWREWDFDNYRFIVHELFLYCVAIFLRNERFEAVANLLRSGYYHPAKGSHGREVMVGFSEFRQYMKSLERRNSRLELRRLSLRADLLSKRCEGTGLDFRHLMQADFVLFIRNLLEPADESSSWWPETLLYAGRAPGALEIFARSRSAAYFEKVKVIFDVSSKEPLVELVREFKAGNQKLPRWEFDSFNPGALMGIDDIGSRP